MRALTTKPAIAKARLQPMNPRSMGYAEPPKLPMCGSTPASSVFDTPNQRARVAAYWSTAVLGNTDQKAYRSEEHTSELQSHLNLVCRLLLEKKKKHTRT